MTTEEEYELSKATPNLTGTIENWYHDELFNCIWGEIYHDIHERWLDGTWFHTSSLQISRGAAKHLKAGDVVRTLNSIYKLGEPKSSVEELLNPDEKADRVDA